MQKKDPHKKVGRKFNPEIITKIIVELTELSNINPTFSQHPPKTNNIKNSIQKLFLTKKILKPTA